MNRNREAQTHEHSGGVELHGRVDELGEVSKVHDVVKPSSDLRLLEPEQHPVDVNVLPSGHLLVEANPNAQERGDAATCDHRARCWLSDTSEQSQQRALTGAIAPDDADRL